MRRYLNYALSILLMAAFAYITAYFQQYATLIFIAYFVLVILVMLVTTGRSVSKIVKDIEFIQGGERLIEVKSEVVKKLKARDPFIAEETKHQAVSSVISLLPLLVIMAIALVGQLREALLGGARSLLESFVRDERLLTFGAWFCFYLMFFVVAQGSHLISRAYGKIRGIKPLSIASSYVVTSRGVVVDNRLPLKFPLEGSKITLDAKRKFVEVEVGPEALGPQARGTSRIRLYSPNPRELYEVLKRRGA